MICAVIMSAAHAGGRKRAAPTGGECSGNGSDEYDAVHGRCLPWFCLLAFVL
jgi:hypothetical protein